MRYGYLRPVLRVLLILLALGVVSPMRGAEITRLVYKPDGTILVNGKPVPKHPGTDKIFMYYPQPSYPTSARPEHHQGVGIFRIKSNESGEVTSVSVRKSTGWRDLDSAAVSTLRTWRARPGVKREIDTQINFFVQ